jgi:predicted acyltransferase
VTQSFFLPVTLIACMVGLASVLAGAHHMRLFRSDSLAAAAATSLIAWLLVLLAMGYVLTTFNFPTPCYVSCTFRNGQMLTRLV